MKIQVVCGCGSAFEAPEHLAGQVVRCPSCRQPVTIPAPQGEAPPAEPDLSDLSALDQVSLDNSGAHGSTVGQSAAGGSSGRRSRAKHEAGIDSTSKDQAISQEVDDRMTRLYEVYSGKEMRIKTGGGSKLKLLIGLGIAVVTIGVGVGVALHVVNTEYGGLDSMGDMIAGSSDDGVSDEAPVVLEARKQAPDGTVLWQPADASRASGVALAGVEVAAGSSDGTRYDFGINIKPESKAGDRRLSMATSVVLYRSEGPEGPFAQVDRAKVDGFDGKTGSLTFELFDEVSRSVTANVLYYRLSGFDSDGKHLFDTPPGGFAHVPEPSVSQGQVVWDMRSEGGPVPAMRLQARLDAPGWADVLLWQAKAEGSTKEALPDLPDQLPLVIESAVYSPVGIDLDWRGNGRWRMQWEGQELRRMGKPGTQVMGASPYVIAGGLDYNFTPEESAFTSVTRSRMQSDPTGKWLAVAFVPPDASPQLLTAPTPPGLANVSATAYDGRVRLGWDSAGLIAGLERYDGEVQIAIRRVDTQGNMTEVALLPADSTGYTDTELTNNEPASYELALVRSGASTADALIRADAWIDGHGTLSVLVPCPNVVATARIAPEPGLDRLYVSLGLPELSYPETGMPAVMLNDRLNESLSQTSGVAVVYRAALRCFVGADTGEVLSGPMRDVAGSPAQVHLRLVDSTGPTGDLLSLWATDLSTGVSRVLARTDAGQAVEHADQFVAALRTYLDTRLLDDVPEAVVGNETPSLIVVGPIFPVDQPSLYYHSKELTAQLAEAGDQAHDQLAVITRPFWLDDTNQDPRMISHAAMPGTVLIVGRAWTGEDTMPGVSLQAIDARGGRLIDRFTAERVTPEALRQFADWCGTLRLPTGTVPMGNSPLLAAESMLNPIHPVWREALAGASESTETMSFTRVRPPSDADAPVLSFGLPLPPALGGMQAVTERGQNHPLHAIRPYIAPQHPLTFDQWAHAYAEYIKADCASFLAGFERVGRLQQANPVPIKPYLIIRGEHKFTGEYTVPPAAGGMRVTPPALSVRTFFPMGAASQPMG